jgi:small subunit ribosomal protein S20
VEALIGEAFQEIDKAVSKGVLHANTGARRKARLSAAKRAALIKGGLYTPA